MNWFSLILSKFLSKEFLLKLLVLVMETFVKSKKCNMDETAKNDILATIEQLEQ